jgi:hypothetical protein
MLIVTQYKPVNPASVKFQVKIATPFGEVWWLALHKEPEFDKCLPLPTKMIST